MSNGWIGVDLDGTLAHYEEGDGVDTIGDPVPAMIERVKQWLNDGIEVRIFTARVSVPFTRRMATAAIQSWCAVHIGTVLPVTCEKDFACLEIYDDRARQVEANTGRIIGDD